MADDVVHWVLAAGRESVQSTRRGHEPSQQESRSTQNVLALAVRNTTRASQGSLTMLTGRRSWAWDLKSILEPKRHKESLVK